MEYSVLPSFHGFISLWLTLLIGIKWTQESFGCPTECACVQRKVNCEGKNLDYVPSQIPLTTKELILANNNITYLPIIEINYLNELVYLDCSHNRLAVELQFAFVGTVRLIYLDLSFNRIVYIPHHTLSRLGNLMLLNLSNNPNLTLVEKEAFRGNPMLVYLDLSGCGLRHIDDDAFMHLSNLRTLGISNNPWRCDCALLEFCSWTEEAAIHLSNADNVVCTEPKPFRGLQLFGKVKKDLHLFCLVHFETNDFINMAIITYCIFTGGMIAAWLVGMTTVMYYHPTIKADDESEEEEHKMD